MGDNKHVQYFCGETRGKVPLRSFFKRGRENNIEMSLKYGISLE
jgi:hypothetical protein